MEEMSRVAPAHNPPYIAAMRLLAEKLPEIPLVAAFETGFHADDRRSACGTTPCRTSGPRSCTSSGGAFTARAIATSPRGRAELLGAIRPADHLLPPRRLELPVRDSRRQQSVATTMGMSPQTGLPHNNRVGDFDPFALPLIMQADGQVAGPGARRAGRAKRACSGCRGISGDVRDLEEAAAQGNARAQLALDVFVGRDPAVPGRVCWSSWAART